MLKVHLSQQALSVVQAESMWLVVWPEHITREVVLKEDGQGSTVQSMDASHLQFGAVEVSKSSWKVREKRKESVALSNKGKEGYRERSAQESPVVEKKQ